MGQPVGRDRLAVAAMFLANGMMMGLWASLIPGLVPRFGLSSLALGLLILALGLGAVMVMPLTGRMITRRGAGPVSYGFAIPALVALLAIALAPGVLVLGIAIMALGVSLGGMDVAMNACAVAVERRHGRAIMSSSHGFWSLGGFVGGGGGTLAVAIGPTPASAATTKTRLLPRDPALWILGAMALASMVPEGAVLDWAAIYMQRELGATGVASGLAFALFSGAMAIMRFSGDFVRARFGAVRTLRISGIIGALGLGLASMGFGPIRTLVGFALCGLGVANMVPVLFSAAGNHAGLPAAQAISLVTMIGYSGILAAPGLIGMVADHAGLAVIFASLSVLL
jgi:MFS family permease